MIEGSEKNGYQQAHIVSCWKSHMSGKPAARVTDPTACPMSGHGSNPIIEGSPDVFFDGLPAARQGDVSTCASRISTGVSSTVFINGKPAATLGSVGEHGNVIIGGSGTVFIGDRFTPSPLTPLAQFHSPLLRTLSTHRSGNRPTHWWSQGKGMVECRLEHVRHHQWRRHDIVG